MTSKFVGDYFGKGVYDTWIGLRGGFSMDRDGHDVLSALLTVPLLVAYSQDIRTYPLQNFARLLDPAGRLHLQS